MAIELIRKSDELGGILTEAKIKKCALSIVLAADGARFESTLIDFHAYIDEPCLIITHLVPENGNTLIREAAVITVEFSLDETYFFRSKFLDTVMRDGNELIRIAYPEKRKYYRVGMSTEQDIRVVMDADTIITGVIKDISPDGVGFLVHEEAAMKYDLKKALTVEFNLPDGTIVGSRVDIRYVNRMSDEKSARFFCGALFVDLPEDLFDEIVQYVLERKIENEET